MSLKRKIRPRLPVGVARSRRVEHAYTPGRRVYPSAISATIVGAEVRQSYNAECNAPPAGWWSRFHQSLLTLSTRQMLAQGRLLTSHQDVAAFGRRDLQEILFIRFQLLLSVFF